MAADNDFPNNLPDPQTPEGGASAELDPNRFDEMHRRILASLKAPDDDAAMDLPDFDMPDDAPEWAAAIDDVPTDEPSEIVAEAAATVEEDAANAPTLTDAEPVLEAVEVAEADDQRDIVLETVPDAEAETLTDAESVLEAVAGTSEDVPDEAPAWAEDEADLALSRSPETIEIKSPVESAIAARDTVEFAALSDDDQASVAEAQPLATMEFSASSQPEPSEDAPVAATDESPILEEPPIAEAAITATDDATDLDEGIAELLDLPPEDIPEAVVATSPLVDEPEPVAVAEPVEADDSLAHLVAEIDSETKQAAPIPSAAAVAAPSESVAKARYIVFSAVGSRYAVPIEGVTEIGRVPKVTHVPNLPEWVRGVTNLRGDVMSVIDFRGFFDLPSLETTDSDRMMVVRTGRGGFVTGLIVDGVSGMRDLADTEIVPPSTLIEDKVAGYLRGVCTRDDALLAVLDLEKFLSSSEIRQFESL